MKKTEFEKVHLVTQSKHCKVFNIVKRKDKYIITMNMFNVSENEFDSIEDAENYIDMKPWELILNGMLAIQEFYKKQEKDENNTNKN